MNGGTINIKLRPIKLAFLVEPADKNAILEAIQISSFLWGGIYNPIIPVFSNMPKIWKIDNLSAIYKGKEVLKGYLQAFNPDYVIPIGRCIKRKFDVGNREIIAASEIFSKINEDGTPKYGIGLFEILSDFYNKELKFTRRKPIKFFLPEPPKQNKLFFASIFGSLSVTINNIINERWAERLGAIKQKVDFSNYGEILKAPNIFIRRILNHEIKMYPRNSCLFFMDADSTYDIIDYWNLRALGWNVAPVAKQSASNNDTKLLAKSYIEKHSGMNRWHDYYIYATLMKARSIRNNEMKEFIESVDIVEDKRANGSRYIFQNNYPRLWDEWARDKDGANCQEIEATTNEIDFSGYQENVNFHAIDPAFINQSGGHDSPRYANVIELRTYCDDDLYAEVIPDCGAELTNVLSGIGLTREWKFTKKESAYFPKHENWRIRMPIPKAEDAFKAWLLDNGFEAKLSSAGRIAKQMIKRLGGVWGLNIIANKELIDLLRKMEDGKEMDKEAFWGRISRTGHTKYFRADASRILKRYINAGMFRLGAKIQCPICSHYCWYDIDSLKYKLQCSNCLDNFDLPSNSPDKIKWSYRTFGPFSLNGSAEGAYSTLLVLRLFSTVLDAATTPMMNFLTKIDGSEKEIDLGLLLKEHRYDHEDEVRPAFAECKTYNEFEKSDVEKLAKLAKRFPGAVLVFATLRDTLTKREVKLLKPLVNKCRRYWKDEQPYNPVLILTKTELFADMSVEQAWKDSKDEKYKKFAERDYYSDRLFHICDATQQLYLGMRPWHDETYEKFERKWKLKQTRKIQTQQTI